MGPSVFDTNYPEDETKDWLVPIAKPTKIGEEILSLSTLSH